MIRYLLLSILISSSLSTLAQTGPGGYGKTTDVNSGLVLWLKADAGVTSGGDGTDVVSWADQSASGLTAIPGGTTGAAPLYDADGGSNFNNQPVIFFDDPQDNWMYIEGDAGELAALENQTEMSIFFVFNSDSRTGNKNIISKRDGNNSNQQFTFYQNNNILSRYVQNTETGASITVGTTHINSATFNNGVLAQWLNQAAGNGGSGTSPLPSNNSDFNIGTFDNSGGSSFDNRTFEGEIAEIIIYNIFLNEAEKIAVENYLGAKYGAALSTDDYWDEVTYATYDNEIAGIGQSDVGSMANSATSAILSISGGDDRDNGEWLFWGHDNGSISSYVTLEGISNRLTREWAVDTTGNMGAVTVSIAAADLPSTGLASPSFNLVVDDDGDFSSGATTHSMTLNGGNYEVDVNLSAGQRMTISYDPPAPAGVSAPLAFWLDADAGVENGSSNPASDGEDVAVWQDLSSNNADGQNGTSPSFNTSNALNFRPTVIFDDANSEYLEVDLSDLDNSDFTIVGLVRRASSTANQAILGSESNGTDSLSLSYTANTTLDGRTLSSSTTSTAVNGFDDPTESPALLIMDYNGGSTLLSISELRDGSSSSSANTSATVFNPTVVPIGNLGRAFTSDYFDGDIAEIVVFPSSLSGNDSTALISNLAIQYGVSLNDDYTDEAGVVLWDYSVSGADGFSDEVTAIGFDESFNLDQRVSKSALDSIVIATSADFISLNSDVGRPQLSDGQTVFIANDDDPYTLDQTFNGVANSRLDRTWRVDENGTPGAVVIAIPTSVGSLNFMLVNSTNDDFVTGVDQVALVESGGYYYATHDFSDGDYFTFGFDETEIWYSYKSGVWSDWTNWTRDGAVSALLVNPDMKTPLPGDSVVIKSGKTITVDVQDISVELMEINGTLDLATTGGHDFNYIFGFGKMRMAGFGGNDNYPSGTDTLFYDLDEGGTVEVYGGDITLDQDRNFRNLIINLDLNSNVATMLGNSISISKDLTVTRGDLRFNDNSSTTSINLSVDGDVLIESEGSMLVGTGNARHELDLLGDFTNQGLVEFTNRNSAVTGSEASDGIVDLNFKSSEQDQALTLQNTARLYRIEIDKGVDDSYTVDITADDPSYFNLFGYAAQSHGEDNQLVSSLNENINALGLYFGTVKIGANVDIPVLNTGGNYNVSEGAQIWVDGGSIAKSGGTAIVPYGTMRITSGTIDADINSGITTRGNATLIIEGGTVTVRQFRTSVFGATNQGGLVQTGGVFNILGATAGSTNTGYTPFNLTYEGNVFNLAGGVVNIAGPNSKGGIFIGSDPENVSTTGGTVNFIIDNSNDFIIASRASFYNLTMEKTTASGSAEFVIDALTTGSGGSANRTVQGDSLDMTIVNDLTIADQGNSTIFDANGHNIGITGTLTVESGATMTMVDNTLTFEGEGTSFIDIGTTGPLALDSLVIDKTLDTDLVRVTNGPDRAMTIASYFNHNSGQFDYLADTIVLSGELVLSDTIGLDTSTGELLLNGVSLQTITSSGGYIYDLVLDNAGDSLSGDLVVDSLVLDNGVFNINDNKLTVTSAVNTNNVFGSSLMIQTSGNASDGGINYFIGTDGEYEYPLGISGKYTPAGATISLSALNTGFVQIRPVDNGLSTVELNGDDSLSYYWRVSHSDFGSSDLPTIDRYVFVYDNSDVSGGNADTDFVAGKVLDELPYTRSYEGREGIQVNADTILFDGLLAESDSTGLRSGFTVENANYTAGFKSKFAGSIEIYYSRRDGNWNSSSTWSTVSHTSSTNAGTYPQAGDIAIVSYDGSDFHRIDMVGDGTVAVLEFNSIPSVPIFELSRVRLDPGEILTVTQQVLGIGDIQLRINSDGNGGATSNVIGDIGDFAANSESMIQCDLEAGSGVFTVDNSEFPGEFPTLRVYGGQTNLAREVQFNYDFSAKNLLIDGEAAMLINSDIKVEDTTRLGTNSYGRLRFPNTDNEYIFETDVLLFENDPDRSTENQSVLDVESGNSFARVHRLIINENFVINGDNDPFVIDLLNTVTENNVILEVAGSGNHSFSIDPSITNGIVEAYRLVVNKGSDTTSTFTIENDLNLPDASSLGEQPIEFLVGKLILNDPATSIELADASEFRIPLGSGLEVTQGTVTTANDASINLDGLLRINGGTATLDDSDIIYSNTGEALIDISSGVLTVGNQIRRPSTTSSGILKYRQSGGTVLVGADGESENGRAMFEVLNPGSEFTLSGGDFTIRRGVTGDDNPSLELIPDTYSVTGSTIILGDGSTPAVGSSNFFNIKSAIPLNNLTITNDVDFPVARAFSLALTVDGTFEIQPNGDFDANGFQITLNGDLDNDGTYTNDDDLTLFSASGAQEIRGSGVFTIYDLTKDNTGTLTLATGPIVVLNDLRVEQGVVALGTNVLELRGDAYIESTVTNLSGGYLSFNSDLNNQNLYGLANNTITLGKIQIDNPLGVDITDGFGYDFSITEELALLEGVFNVGGSLVTVKEGGVITGDTGGTAQSDFSINNMVQTNSSFVDNGLKIEYFTLGSDSTIFFPVGEEKYTPVAFNLLSTAGTGTIDSEGGSIRVRPANERHPTIINNIEPNSVDSSPPTPMGDEEADLDDITNVLQYYWVVVAEDIDGAGIEGSADFFYDADDISLDNSPDGSDPTNKNDGLYGTGPTSFTTADYISARLLSNDTQWDKFAPVDFDEGNNSFNVPLGSGILSAGITGDYTAGVGNSGGNSNATTTNIEGAIPDEIVEYVSVATGSYGTDANWSPNPGTGIGPVGGRVTISAGDEISLDLNNVRLYETILESGGTLIIESANFGHRLGNVRGTGTIQLDGTGELPAGEYSAFFDCDGGAVDYSGTGDYNVLGSVSQIRKVSFTGTGQRIMPNNVLEVCDTLYVNGPTLGPSLSLNTGQTITIGDIATANDLLWIENGGVTLSNSTILDVNGSVDFEGGTFTGGSGTTIYIYENLSRTATTLNWNNTTVRFDGAAAQTITGNFQGTRAFDNIRINNSSATGITLSGDVDIDGLLTFQDGHFYTSADDSLRLRSSGTKTGASSDSHVKGPMIKNNIAASSTYTFPVGKGTRYAPVSIVDVGTGSDNWKAEYFLSNSNGTSSFDPDDPGSGFQALTEIASDMWTVESQGSNTSKIRVTYGAWHGSSDQTDLRVVWWDAAQSGGARWENQGGNPISGSVTTGTVTSENAISFSSQDFTLGAVSEDALPVEMLYFEGAEDGGAVLLDWATATEIDNDHFEVQRSQDGRDWEVIGVVNGAGTTVEEQVYDFSDFKPYVGNSYYRLRQVDYDGKFAFTDIILVNVRLEPISLNVYPNPIEDIFTVDIKGINANEETSYSIISLQGAYVGQGILIADEAGRINEQLTLSYGQPAGIYILRVATSQRVFRFNLIKK